MTVHKILNFGKVEEIGKKIKKVYTRQLEKIDMKWKHFIYDIKVYELSLGPQIHQRSVANLNTFYTLIFGIAFFQDILGRNRILLRPSC